MAGNMTVNDEIMAIAAEISKAEESEKTLLSMLCAAAGREVESRLRPGLSRQDCEGAFICASAWLAAADLAGTRGGGEEFSSLRAGDMTVVPRAEKERAESCERLRRRAWELMAPYIRDSGFHFCGVQG